MNRSIAIGAAALAGLLGVRLLSRARAPGERVGSFLGRRMEHMMASLPDNSPPKLVASVLPRLRDQNEEIIQMLREQNDLLRKHLERPN